MKTIVYLRLTKDGRVRANQKFDQDPIRDTYKKAIPTIYLALQLTIPDEAFKPPNISAAITVPIEKLGTAVEVVDPMKTL